VSGFGPSDWVAAVEASADLPDAIAVQLLSRALVHGTPDVRFSALGKLASLESPAALPVLKTWSGRADTPGHLIALAAVAGSGDAFALSELKTQLPTLEGEDRLAAGVALARQKDARGIEAIREVMSGPDELLRLQAAAALVRLGDKSGLEWLGGELGSTNVWMRLRALEMLRGLGVPPTPAVWRQMSDPMPWIRVRAAQLVLEGCRSPAVAAVAKR
jgi:HEAT repeat protein